MADLTILLDRLTGAMLIEGPDHVPSSLRDQLEGLLGPSRDLGCAVPLQSFLPDEASAREIAEEQCVRVSGVYHSSLVEGPGRRSSVLFTSCPLGCPGCWVPQLHSSDGGRLVPVNRLADALLDPAYQRDGISILGGEPFAQPEGLLALVLALRAGGCPHILVYSGYTYEGLCRMAKRQPPVGAVLAEIDMLVDGPYVEALAGEAGPWTGSGNQRVIDVPVTRGTGRVVGWDELRLRSTRTPMEDWHGAP